MQKPVNGAFFISILFALVLFPYWWLADQWSRSYFTDTSTQFTFTSTSFILILAIIDSAFLIRYYQIRQKNEMKEISEKVRIGAENYRSLIENAPFPIVIVNQEDFKILVINNEAARLFAIDPVERTGKPVSNRFLTAVQIQEISEILLDRQHIAGFELSFQTTRGQRIFASLSAGIIDYLGEKAIFAAFVDITERVALEQEIIRKEEKFSTFFHEIPNPVMILSDTGEIVEVNKGCEQFFGRSKEDIITHHLEEFLRINERKIDFQGAGAFQETTPFETTITLPSGENRFVTLHFREITIRDTTRVLLVIQDIDEIKRTQNAITQANNQLSILTSITRHDILNRVMVVLSFGEFLRQKVTSEPEKTWVHAIIRSGEDIQTLIDFTHQYQDLGVNPPKWQNPGTIMQKKNIISLLSSISVTLPRDSFEIYADPMFEKVLYNLVDNSVRHGEKVTKIIISYEKAGPNLIFRYEDDGTGIDDADKKKLFTKGFGKNTGLGLFLIREILSLTGISITEGGEKGVGVRFDMTVPAGAYRYGTPSLVNEVS